MQQFIPFEDDWDALAQLRSGDLVPYQVGMLASAGPPDHALRRFAHPQPACRRSTPIAWAVPAGNSST